MFSYLGMANEEQKDANPDATEGYNTDDSSSIEYSISKNCSVIQDMETMSLSEKKAMMRQQRIESVSVRKGNKDSLAQANYRHRQANKKIEFPLLTIYPDRTTPPAESKFMISDYATGKVQLGLVPRVDFDGDKKIDESKLKNCYSDISGTDYSVRQGPNYKKHKTKKPSLEALYDFAGMDSFTTERKGDGWAAQVNVQLPQKIRDGAKEVGLPPFICVTANAPDASPGNPLWGTVPKDGPGYALSHYYVIKESTIELARLRESERSGAVKQLQKLCTITEITDPLLDQFKIFIRLRNVQDLALPDMLKRVIMAYLGKPYISGPEHFIRRDESLNYLDIQLDLYRYSYISRFGFYTLKSQSEKVVADFGILFEARQETEMPERIIGCHIFHRMSCNADLVTLTPVASEKKDGGVGAVGGRKKSVGTEVHPPVCNITITKRVVEKETK